MEKTKKVAFFVILASLVFFTAQIASAIFIESTESDIILPGKSGQLTILVENDLDYDIEDISLSLDLTNTPFITIGSSEDSVNEIQEDDYEKFIFTLGANINAKPGDYNIPYTLEYKDAPSIKKGTIGIKIRAETELNFISSLDNPIKGEKSKLSLKIVNKNLGEAKFVSVKLVPDGFTLLSEDSIYIGNIDSDDFETANFNIIINNISPTLIATINYYDLDNKHYSKQIALPLNVYTIEKAYELGIKKRSYVSYYISILFLIIIIWLISRAIRKKIRKRKSLQSANAR